MAVEIDPLTGKPKKTTVNFPYPQPGQNLPMVPTAIQQPAPIQTQQPVAQQNVAPVQQNTMQGAATVFDPNQSKQVIQQAQNKALQGTSQATAGLVSQQTQNLLKDPSMGVDYAAQRKTALDQLARRQASDFEALRQATGGRANTGFNFQELVGSQLQQRQEKTDAQRQLEYDEQNRRQSDLLKALAAGKETVGMEQGLQTSDIQNMITAAGGALGFAELASKQDILLSEQDFKATQSALDRELSTVMQGTDIAAQKEALQKKLDFEAKQAELGYKFTAEQNELNRLLQTNLANLDAQTQKEVINLKALVDKDMLMTAQDFEATENELNRQLQEALQNNDFAQANKMATMLQDFDLIKMGKANEYDTAKMTAMNAFQENLVMKDQDFAKAMEYIKLENEKALMDNDTDRQKVLMDKQAELDLQKMTQNFGFNEKLAILDSELQSAMANGDVERQKQLLSFSNGLEMKKIEQEQGFAQSMAYLNTELQKALQNNDFANAKVLDQMQYDQQMKMHLDQMNIEKARIDLQQQGIDLQKIESEYAKIQDQIKAGILDPSDGVEYLSTVFKDSLPAGFEFTTADPLAVQKAIEQDYVNQQLQYALSFGMNPDGTAKNGLYETVTNADGTTSQKFVGLSDEMMEGFSNHLTSTIYNQDGTPYEADVIAYKTGEKNWSSLKVDSPAYNMLLEDPATIQVPNVGMQLKDSFQMKETGRGSSSRNYFPQLESSKFINIGGSLYAIDSWSVEDKFGDDRTVYKLYDVATGNYREVVADTND